MDLLNVDNDIAFDTDGNLLLVEGTEAIGQHIEMRLKTFAEESVYNVDAGVPWLQVIFKGVYNPEATRFIIYQHVLDTPGVETVTLDPPEYDADTGEVSISGSATTIEGNVDFSAVIGANGAI